MRKATLATNRERLMPAAWALVALAVAAGIAAVDPPSQSDSVVAQPLPTDSPTAAPPFQGTVFIDPDILTEDDPTTFLDLTDRGRSMRQMYDRRVSDWITVEAFLFEARFDDGLSTEFQVNPEFGSTDAARAEAQTYAPVIGRLPTALRTDVKTVWIHQGVELFGGGNNNLLIHTGQGAVYEADGLLEEVFLHEGAHTSLDARHARAQGWLDAQATDGTFISTYARDNPTREDVAESFGPYLALRFRPERISETLARTIRDTIPNRLAYFDALRLDLHPIVSEPEVGSRLVLPWLGRRRGR
jgi:hypothetical protein